MKRWEKDRRFSIAALYRENAENKRVYRQPVTHQYAKST